MPSKRIYPPRLCKNPACYQKTFQPIDKRQLFCHPYCKTYYYNDLRSEYLARQKERLKKTADIDQLLGVYYNYLVVEDKRLDAGWLELSRIDLSLGKVEYNITTGQPIIWYGTFGLERLKDKEVVYLIHCRNAV